MFQRVLVWAVPVFDMFDIRYVIFFHLDYRVSTRGNWARTGKYILNIIDILSWSRRISLFICSFPSGGNLHSNMYY